MSTHTCNHTPPSVNIFSRKEMAHFSWDIPNRLISLLRSLLVQGLAWDLVWSSWREHWKCLTYPERGVWGQLGQWSSYSGYWNDCTVPPFITVNNPLLWDLEGGNGTSKWLWVKEKKMKETLSTQLRFLCDIKFGNQKTWSTCLLFPLYADLQILEWVSWLVSKKLCQLYYLYSGTYLLFWIPGETYSFALTHLQGVRKNIFKIAYWVRLSRLMAKTLLKNSTHPQKSHSYLFLCRNINQPSLLKKQNTPTQRNPNLIPTSPSQGRSGVTAINLYMGLP